MKISLICKNLISLVVGVGCFLQFATCQALQVPRFYAHRGASVDAPENTLASFNLAWAQEADGTETDVQLTSDKKVVCIHDKFTTRTSNAVLAVALTKLKKLKTLDFGSWKDEKYAGEKIPELWELLTTAPHDKDLVIELKSLQKNLVANTAEEVKASGFPLDKVVFISFHWSLLKKMKKALPQARVYGIYRFSKFRKFMCKILKRAPKAKGIIKKLNKYNLDGVSLNFLWQFNQKFIDAFHKANKEVNVWTVNDSKKAEKLQSLGIDSITSDCPGALKAELGLG